MWSFNLNLYELQATPCGVPEGGANVNTHCVDLKWQHVQLRAAGHIFSYTALSTVVQQPFYIQHQFVEVCECLFLQNINVRPFNFNINVFQKS